MAITDMDLHVHAGCEMGGRRQQAYVDALASRGVKLAGLVDHGEFYFTEQSPWHVEFRQNAATKGITLYAASIDGLRQLYDDLDALRASSPIPFATGLEINKVAQTPEAFFERPQYLSNCFSIRDNPMVADFGQVAAQRIRDFAAKIRCAGKPGIINHPFRDRFGTYRDKINAGEAMPPPEQWISADDVKRIAEAAGECGMYLEVNSGSLSFYGKFDTTKHMVVRTIALLNETGAHLTTGSDSHAPPDAQFSQEALWVIRQSGLSEDRFSKARAEFAALAAVGRE